MSNRPTVYVLARLMGTDRTKQEAIDRFRRGLSNAFELEAKLREHEAEQVPIGRSADVWFGPHVLGGNVVGDTPPNAEMGILGAVLPELAGLRKAVRDLLLGTIGMERLGIVPYEGSMVRRQSFVPHIGRNPFRVYFPTWVERADVIRDAKVIRAVGEFWRSVGAKAIFLDKCAGSDLDRWAAHMAGLLELRVYREWKDLANVGEKIVLPTSGTGAVFHAGTGRPLEGDERPRFALVGSKEEYLDLQLASRIGEAGMDLALMDYANASRMWEFTHTYLRAFHARDQS